MRNSFFVRERAAIHRKGKPSPNRGPGLRTVRFFRFQGRGKYKNAGQLFVTSIMTAVRLLFLYGTSRTVPT